MKILPSKDIIEFLTKYGLHLQLFIVAYLLYIVKGDIFFVIWAILTFILAGIILYLTEYLKDSFSKLKMLKLSLHTFRNKVIDGQQEIFLNTFLEAIRKLTFIYSYFFNMILCIIIIIIFIFKKWEPFLFLFLLLGLTSFAYRGSEITFRREHIKRLISFLKICAKRRKEFRVSVRKIHIQLIILFVFFASLTVILIYRSLTFVF